MTRKSDTCNIRIFSMRQSKNECALRSWFSLWCCLGRSSHYHIKVMAAWWTLVGLDSSWSEISFQRLTIPAWQDRMNPPPTPTPEGRCSGRMWKGSPKSHFSLGWVWCWILCSSLQPAPDPLRLVAKLSWTHLPGGQERSPLQVRALCLSLLSPFSFGELFVGEEIKFQEFLTGNIGWDGLWVGRCLTWVWPGHVALLLSLLN